MVKSQRKCSVIAEHFQVTTNQQRSHTMKRLLAPALGLVIVVMTVVQVRATRPANHAAPPPRAASKSISAEGQVVTYPGAEVSVGSDIGGTVATISVNEKDRVRKGDVIAIIRADDT